jgi:hypothetical protein
MVFSTLPLVPLRICMRLPTLFILIVTGHNWLSAQMGGSGIYRVLLQPTGAREAAWGGYCNAFRDKDVTLFSHNPALLNSQMHLRSALNFNTHLKGVWTGNASFAKNIKHGTGGVQISYINYGMMGLLLITKEN